MVGAPDEVRQILIDKDKNFSSRRGWDVLSQLLTRGLMLRDFEDHRLHRRIMQTAFRTDELAGYASLMNPVIEARLKEWGHQGQFELYPSLKALTLDMAADAFIGISLGENATRVNSAFVDTVAASIAVFKKKFRV